MVIASHPLYIRLSFSDVNHFRFFYHVQLIISEAVYVSDLFNHFKSNYFEMFQLNTAAN